MSDFKNITFAIKIKSLEWFKNNANYIDGFFHPIYKLNEDKKYLPFNINGIRNDILYFKIKDEEKIKLYKWGLEKVFYPETDPQYFI